MAYPRNDVIVVIVEDGRPCCEPNPYIAWIYTDTSAETSMIEPDMHMLKDVPMTLPY
jgi:hypothetical protein